VCREHQVGLLIPAMEPELPLLARHREWFLRAGTFPLVSSTTVVETCADKLATAAFLGTLGIASPATYASLESARHALAAGKLSFPLIVKPRWGMGSIGLETCHDDDELEWSYRLVRRRLPRSLIAKVSASDAERSVLIQECLDGTEHGFDVVNDLDGRYVVTFLRRKLRMRAGQTDRAVTIRDAELEGFARKIGTALGHFGCLDGDLVVTKRGRGARPQPETRRGYPFSHAAGADPPPPGGVGPHERPIPGWFESAASGSSGRAGRHGTPARPGRVQWRR
jgi:carbamoyl-phosphate synthase large subunit